MPRFKISRVLDWLLAIVIWLSEKEKKIQPKPFHFKCVLRCLNDLSLSRRENTTPQPCIINKGCVKKVLRLNSFWLMGLVFRTKSKSRGVIYGKPVFLLTWFVAHSIESIWLKLFRLENIRFILLLSIIVIVGRCLLFIVGIPLFSEIFMYPNIGTHVWYFGAFEVYVSSIGFSQR